MRRQQAASEIRPGKSVDKWKVFRDVSAAMALLGALIGCMDVSMNANAVEVERGLKRAIMSSSHGFWSLGGFVGGAGLAL